MPLNIAIQQSHSEAYSRSNDKVHFFELIDFSSNEVQHIKGKGDKIVYPELTFIQSEILHRLAMGLKRATIMKDLKMTYHEYNTHIHDIKEKFSVSTLNEIVLKATELGYL
jgi:DNA-binding CsgD family transcriptional regulator